MLRIQISTSIEVLSIQFLTQAECLIWRMSPAHSLTASDDCDWLARFISASRRFAASLSLSLRLLSLPLSPPPSTSLFLSLYISPSPSLPLYLSLSRTCSRSVIPFWATRRRRRCSNLQKSAGPNPVPRRLSIGDGGFFQFQTLPEPATTEREGTQHRKWRETKQQPSSLPGWLCAAAA